MKYKISQAWCTGRAHLEQGMPCQDKVYLVRGEEVFCAALADGAGSRKYSEYGAQCVSACVTEQVCARFDCLWEMDAKELAVLLVEECLSALSQMKLPLDELGCTLLFFAAHRDGRFLSGHLGDGVQILVEGEEERLSVLSEPENGARRNETYFVTSYNAGSHLRIQRGTLCAPGAVLLMSDGPEACLYRYGDKTPAEACRTMARWLRDGEEQTVSHALKDHMELMFSEYSGDDMSLFVITWDNDR